MIRINLMLIFWIVALHSTAQTNDWTTVKVDGLGSIGLPPEMEVQGGTYKDINDHNRAIMGINSSKVIFQQKNLNQYSDKSFNTYARVFIRIQKGAAGDFKKLSEKLTQADANEVNSSFRSQIEQEAPTVNAIIFDWKPATTTTLNGQNAIKLAYKRQVGVNKPVSVEMYLLQNNDRMHVITFEYWLDENNWSTVFKTIKTTIKILKQ